MKLRLFFFSLLLCAGVHATPLLVGASEVSSFEAPWVVKIEKNGAQHCSGSLIASRWILTAGHCFSDALPSSYVILGGGTGKRIDLVPLPPVKRILIHPKFFSSSLTPFYDIALVELAKDVSFERSLKTIALMDSETLDSLREHEPVSIFGWGNTDKALTAPTGLRKIVLPLVPERDYPEMRKKLFFKRFPAWLDSSRYLLTFREKISTCGGDSGTGWTMTSAGETYLVAVHNAGDDCESVSVGNVVSNHFAWIELYLSSAK